MRDASLRLSLTAALLFPLVVSLLACLKAAPVRLRVTDVTYVAETRFGTEMLTAAAGNRLAIVHLIGPPESVQANQRSYEWVRSYAEDQQGRLYRNERSNETESESSSNGPFPEHEIHPMTATLIFELPKDAKLRRLVVGERVDVP